jgi:hypothetical protein
MRQQKPPAVTDDEDVNNIIKLLLAQFPGCAGLSVNETCTALRVKRDKVYELINKGEPG